MTVSTLKHNMSGDIWGGFAAMLVALPSAIAFGVTIFAPLGSEFGAKGALAGMLGVTALGLIAAVPPVIFGLVIQKHLVRGLTFGALKQ